MMSGQSNIIIFTGRFGSGKTEIALNYSIQLADRGARPLLVDLDIVTPYFLTREKAEEVRQHGVQVVTPFEVGQYLHVPALSPRILGAIEQPTQPVVLDVGGDMQGARALLQYAATIARRDYTMHFVVNPYRPFMDTVGGVKRAVREIEASAGLRVSSLVSNPNLMSESTPELLEQGHSKVLEAAQALNVPVAWMVMSEALAAMIKPPVGECPVLVIHRFFLMFDAA